MQNAVAFSDNDVTVVAWSYGHKLDGCMGFAVYRIAAGIALFAGLATRMF